MAKQTFTTGQVLTAAQMTALQLNDYNQTVSPKVASYTLVASDAGTRITMSNASATTITVNTALFAAGDTLFITNIGAGACTITAGTATVSTASSRVLAQYDSGTLYFTSTGVAIWEKYQGAAAGGGGKVLQVVQATYATETASSTTTYAASGLTVSITPTSATSKIYVHAVCNGLTKGTGSVNNAANVRLLRNATTTIITSSGIGYTGTDMSNQDQGVIQYLDSPATTSATTYDVYFANRFASGTVYIQDGNITSVITAWEIGA